MKALAAIVSVLSLSILVAAQATRPQMSIPAIAKAANGAIVSIIMSDKDGETVAEGTGFLIGSDGRILTNYHVIENGSSAIVKLPDGAFYVVDGVLASDKARDVAIIKAHGANFRTLTLGNSDNIEVGEEVVAIGNPLSLESTVSNGIVSAIRIAETQGGKFLQITAPISHGSSGGPLFNKAGEVVGITAMGIEAGANLNFAIPINDAKRLLLAKSSTIQPLPNEPEPVQEQKHDEQSSTEVLPTLDQKVACNELARQAHSKYVTTTPIYRDRQSNATATYSSHLDVKSSTCFVIVFETVRMNIKLANGTPDVLLDRAIYVLDAIEGTKYGQLTQGVLQSVKPVEHRYEFEGLPSAGFVLPLDGDYGKTISITADDNETGTAWFRIALLKLLGIHLKVE